MKVKTRLPKLPTWAEMCELEWQHGCTLGSRVGLGLPPRRPEPPRAPKRVRTRAVMVNGK